MWTQENLMPNIVFYVAASLDGYIATPEGGVEWLAPFESAEAESSYPEFYASVDGLVMGSRTYEQVLSFGEWPYGEKPCWVFSQRDLLVTQPTIKVTRQSPEEIAVELQQHQLQRVWLVGGAALTSAFRAKGLITEYIITIVPVILGGGIPLFIAPSVQENLQLISTKRYSNGLVELQYLRDGSPQVGH